MKLTLFEFHILLPEHKYRGWIHMGNQYGTIEQDWGWTMSHMMADYLGASY
jgi:hypothetical protein